MTMAVSMFHRWLAVFQECRGEADKSIQDSGVMGRSISWSSVLKPCRCQIFRAMYDGQEAHDMLLDKS